MKKTNLLILLLLIFMHASLSIFPDVKIDKIAIINLEEILEAISTGQSTSIDEIKKEKEELQEKLQKIKENIMKLEERKLKEKNQEKKLSYEKKIDELKKQYKDYYKFKNYQIEKKLENIHGAVFREIYGVVQRIAEKEGYTLVLDINTDGIFYYSIDIDITNKVIEYFKKEEEGADEQ